jgi:DNA (cytosine-5)-methyltransferase 1
MTSVISLFSGCGGLDLGFEMAGFRPVIAYDIFESAVVTYNTNRDQTIAKCVDLTKLDANEIVDHIQDKSKDEAPIGVIGGSPCQAFSRSNVKPKEDDARRTLPGRYAQLLGELNKQYPIHFFVFENVQGITFKRHEKEFAHFRFLFEESGFELYEALLNAKDFSVPQNRPRVFIVGLNKKLYSNNKFVFPQPVSKKANTIADSFANVFGDAPWPEPAFYSKELKPQDIPFHPNHWTMVPRSPKFKNGYLNNGHAKGRSFRVLDWEKPSWTVAYGNREIHIHPSRKRRLSIFEAMILQGFPQEYVLTGNFSEQVKQVSDAVPPPLAYHLALSIFDFLALHRSV